MVALTFPDGARREFPDNITGLDIAKGISPSLAKRTVAMALDGELADLTDPIGKDAKIEFVSRDDPRALELIRHDAAHVLAEAVPSLWPGTQVNVARVILNPANIILNPANISCTAGTSQRVVRKCP